MSSDEGGAYSDFNYEEDEEYEQAEYYDEYEDGDVNMGFNNMSDQNEQKKEFDVDFKVLTLQDIISTQKGEVNQVSSILGMEPSISEVILRHFRWNKEKLLEKYTEDPAGILSRVGLSMLTQPPAKIIKVPDFFCNICCSDGELDTFAINCGHRFCTTCYCRFITQKIVEEGECRDLRCPGECREILDQRSIEALVTPETLKKYETLLIRTYVDDMDYLKWCPAPNCDFIVECHVRSSLSDKIIPSVLCRCGYSFCFNCIQPNHLPVPCFILKKWLKKCEDDSETSNWISSNTKECPKCFTSIEKNGGCNHMTCKKCTSEFCWICLGPWSEHGNNYYGCNRFNEASSVEARTSVSTSRTQLKRYLHYYDRYANHGRSANLEKDLIQKTDKKMEELQKSTSLTWIEVQFFKKAVEVLVECRTTLKYTYAFAFYLERTNMTELFEDNQRDLEIAVESLSELLERPIDFDGISQLKQQVVDKTVYVKSRRDVLLQDTAKGLSEDRWTYLNDGETNSKM